MALSAGIRTFLLCALAASLSAGCSPAGAARPALLQDGTRQVTVDVFQDGRKVAPVNGVRRLRAAPFELELSGDLRWASYHAAAGGELAGKLSTPGRPLVLFAGTAAPAEGGRLHVFRGRAESDEAAEIFTADERFFIRQWGAREPQARELAERLSRKFGAPPAIACFGRFPLPCADAAASPRYFLSGATGLGGERLRGRFRVEALREGASDLALGAIPRLHLLVFLEGPIDREFRSAAWTELVLEFVPAPAK
ncbi:MAG TPA: hypothetical protein PK280_00825 [Planctomycetota bacterium]|nr:hypothetical protein [Planctomycetota bacterium]